MRILVANVNTTASMTDGIAAADRAVASPGTEIVGITPSFGAEACEGNVESYLATIAVMDAVAKHHGHELVVDVDSAIEERLLACPAHATQFFEFDPAERALAVPPLQDAIAKSVLVS